MLTYIIIVALAIALGQTLSMIMMMTLMTSNWFVRKMTRMTMKIQNKIIDEMK